MRRTLPLVLLGTLSLLTGFAYAQDKYADNPGSAKAPPLSPADSIATMKIQPGYKITPVLTEPHIHEPAVVAWDGNGRMYVVEMRTYMQNIDGKGALTPTSRVSRHEDTNGDGVYDKHTVFADNLKLPRMVLPLLDRVIIRETNTLDLKSYQDTDGDGVADKVELWHEGGRRGGNLEHQPSGLVWNIDNWIYTTYSHHRYRFTNGKVQREPVPHGSGQWGLTHDNVGRMFYSSAGGENPAMDFQQPIVYGKLTLKGELAPGFHEVYPIDNVPDVQGGPKRLKGDGALNQFTGCGGQSIYRGNNMPADFDGDLIIPEPVGRLIRRAKVTNDDGRIVLSNRYESQEFISARDPNFRPINSATGPDGCLYIVDMYRGIIQEANWVRKDSYLRGVVQDYELDKNIGRGRIFRVDHETTQRGAMPKMLDETPAQLVAHLSHPNGWWRSEAQKLIVLHGDTSVVGQLESLARTGSNALGRLHALWTLEGLDSVSDDLLKAGFADADDRIRSAAIRISETRIKTNRAFDSLLEKMARDPNPNVAIQTLLSVNHAQHPAADEIVTLIKNSHPKNQWIQSLEQQISINALTAREEQRKLEELRRKNRVLADSVERGKTIYSTLCATCHGDNGKGRIAHDKNGELLAPPLVGSSRVLGHKERLNRILLHGLVGPVDDVTYPDGLMPPMGNNKDRWLADIANFVRNNWGNQASLIKESDIARTRNATAKHAGPWTLKTLQYYDPPFVENRSQWVLTSSHHAENLSSMIDGDSKTRWDTGKYQTPGMWLAIELPEPMKVFSLKLDARRSDKDYPRGYAVQLSANGTQWSDPVATGSGDGPVTEIELDAAKPARHIRITQTGAAKNKYWAIHDLAIKAISANVKPAASLTEVLSKYDTKDLVAKAMVDGDAVRGAKLFHLSALTCTKCHTANNESQLGPNLAEKRDGVTREFLVESILEPSKVIRKDFVQSSYLTFDGLVVTGFLVSEDDEKLVLREGLAGKEITILQDDIEDSTNSKVSAMPQGLVNQLADEGQFADLIRFLIEVSEGEPGTLERLKKQADK